MNDPAQVPVDIRHCAAGEAIDILQEKWVLHIVHSLLHGPKGFNELGREVGGCNPTTLTQRLCRLEALGLVSKAVRSVAPPRCSYGLTDDGRALEGVIASIRDWADSHLPADGAVDDPEGAVPANGDASGDSAGDIAGDAASAS